MLLFLAAGVAGGLMSRWFGGAATLPPPQNAGRVADQVTHSGLRDRGRTALEGRLRALETRLAAETAQRQLLEKRLATVRDELGALVATQAKAGPAVPAPVPARDPAGAPGKAAEAAVDEDASSMERALVAAGVDTATAQDIKRRGDELALAEMYLRDQATREHWLNTPRFSQELAAIEAQRTSIRDEIGDAAYDGYLYALGRPNRVVVEDVLAESPAEDAGLRPGDLILSYGAARIFHQQELVEQTRGGAPGETVRLDVKRNGERVEVDVPRGPLGVRIGATQDVPDAAG